MLVEELEVHKFRDGRTVETGGQKEREREHKGQRETDRSDRWAPNRELHSVSIPAMYPLQPSVETTTPNSGQRLAPTPTTRLL